MFVLGQRLAGDGAKAPEIARVSKLSWEAEDCCHPSAGAVSSYHRPGAPHEVVLVGNRQGIIQAR